MISRYAGEIHRWQGSTNDKVGRLPRRLCKTGYPDAPLPQYNRSNREHYSSYYDAELCELIRKRFAPEIDRFGYAFEEQ